MKQLARTLRRRTGEAMAEVDRLTGEVADLARQTLAEVQVVGRNARRALGRRPGDGRLGRLSASCRSRSATPIGCWPGRPAPGRQPGDPRSAGELERSGRPPDPQGQAPASDPVRLQLAGRRGRAWGHRRPPAPAGQPGGRTQLVPAVQRVAAVTGRVAATVVGDRGFGTAANDRALAELGVTRIGLQRKGRLSPTRSALERTRPFRRLRNCGRDRGPHQPPQALLWAAAHPPASAARCQDLAGLGIFAYHLQRMTVVLPDDPKQPGPDSSPTRLTR